MGHSTSFPTGASGWSFVVFYLNQFYRWWGELYNWINDESSCNYVLDGTKDSSTDLSRSNTPSSRIYTILRNVLHKSILSAETTTPAKLKTQTERMLSATQKLQTLLREKEELDARNMGKQDIHWHWNKDQPVMKCLWKSISPTCTA